MDGDWPRELQMRRNVIWRDAEVERVIAENVLAEREACAKIAEEEERHAFLGDFSGGYAGWKIAARIRERGKNAKAC